MHDVGTGIERRHERGQVMREPEIVVAEVGRSGSGKAQAFVRGQLTRTAGFVIPAAR
jgi:hypothetical protein